MGRHWNTLTDIDFPLNHPRDTDARLGKNPGTSLIPVVHIPHVARLVMISSSTFTTVLILGCESQAPWPRGMPGGVVTVPLRKPPKLPTPSNSVPALRPKPHLPGLGEQDVEDGWLNKVGQRTQKQDGTQHAFSWTSCGVGSCALHEIDARSLLKHGAHWWYQGPQFTQHAVSATPTFF